ncbi:hypothetical protein GGR08_000541 [Bartonella fuyuanensis]|uniref:Uncharacterized protein n=1 Tax=Bartonella fuyuanensis TaxID=1460968 RepID=A0A840E239_9HYPH|nr:hypothetical protein [Bartonella fuyuanensis]MBB4076248.1 hypothetical protein [Bartonella fuyuanensis]
MKSVSELRPIFPRNVCVVGMLVLWAIYRGREAGKIRLFAEMAILKGYQGGNQLI